MIGRGALRCRNSRVLHKLRAHQSGGPRSGTRSEPRDNVHTSTLILEPPKSELSLSRTRRTGESYARKRTKMDRVTAPGYQNLNNTDNRELQITESHENAQDYGVCLAEIVYPTRISSTPAQHHPGEAAQRSSPARHDGKLWDDPRRHTKPSPCKELHTLVSLVRESDDRRLSGPECEMLFLGGSCMKPQKQIWHIHSLSIKPDLQQRCPCAGAQAQPPPHLEEKNYLQKKRDTSSCTANMPVTPAPAMMAAQRRPRTASWCVEGAENLGAGSGESVVIALCVCVRNMKYQKHKVIMCVSCEYRGKRPPKHSVAIQQLDGVVDNVAQRLLPLRRHAPYLMTGSETSGKCELQSTRKLTMYQRSMPAPRKQLVADLRFEMFVNFFIATRHESVKLKSVQTETPTGAH